MKVTELTKQWQCNSERGKSAVTFPYVSPCFGKVDLRICTDVTASRAFLDVDGVSGVADVYVGGECFGTVVGASRRLVPLGNSLGSEGTIGLSLEDGGGITRGVKLHYSDSRTYIRPYGLFVRTESVDGQGAEIVIETEIDGDEYEKRKLSVEYSIINARGKRSCRKKKNFVYTGGEKTVALPVKMRRAYPYLSDQPYVYTLRAVLSDQDGNVLDEAETPFGITLPNRFDVALNGATLSHSNGLLGNISHKDAERRKLSALRDLGYNCVRYVGCPSDSALTAADELGLKVIVDIFDNWTYPKEGSLSHVAFGYEAEERAAEAVRTLRNHPCVIMYSVSNGSEETYGRRGSEYAERIINTVRICDGSRPVACTLRKLVPTRGELLACGAKKSEIKGNDAALVKLGDELGLPEKLTADFAGMTDAVIYCDGLKPTDKPYIRSETSVEEAFAALEEAEDNESMLGSLSANGMDYSERGIAVSGDVDFTCLPALGGQYRSMLAGSGNSFILVGSSGLGFAEGRQCWKATDGETVNVKVFTRGDVVALYLNGYLVGRRLAGKVNKYYASFDVEYHEGTLEAVTFLRGREYDRVSLTTPSAAKSVKLLTGSRKIGPDDLCYVDVWVLDGNGETAADFNGDLTLKCEGGCEIIAVGNEYGSCAEEDVCTVVNGHALIVMRATEAGRITLKVLGRGLNYGRLTVTATE